MRCRFSLCGFALLLAVLTAACNGAAPTSSSNLSRLSTSSPSSLSGAGTPITALWPERRAAQAAAVQEEVDGGASSVHWRIEPTQVADHFVHDVLGWSTYVMNGPVRRGTQENGTPTRSIAVCHLSCPSDALDGSEVITLSQPVKIGFGGIWSVTGVEAAGRLEPTNLSIGPPTLTAGSAVSAFTSATRFDGIPQGTHLMAGSGYEGRCGTVTEAHPVVLWRSYIHYLVATASDVSCGPSADPVSMLNDSLSSASGYTYELRTAPDTAARVASLHLFDQVRPPGVTIVDLSAQAVEFRQVNAGRVDHQLPPRRFNRNPSTLPPCRLDAVTVAPPRAISVSATSGSQGISAKVRATGEAWCRYHARFSLAIVGADGSEIPLHVPPGGTAISSVNGPFPSYVPGRGLYAKQVSWQLTGACRGTNEQQVTFRMTDLSTGRSYDSVSGIAPCGSGSLRLSISGQTS